MLKNQEWEFLDKTSFSYLFASSSAEVIKYTLLDAINVMINFSYQKLESITSFNGPGVFLAFLISENIYSESIR